MFSMTQHVLMHNLDYIPNIFNNLKIQLKKLRFRFNQQ